MFGSYAIAVGRAVGIKIRFKAVAFPDPIAGRLQLENKKSIIFDFFIIGGLKRKDIRQILCFKIVDCEL